ncbi:hypothetical protein [Bacteroidetes bacterium endosymbiont of Geopemphigus sp.]|nr:hypothetical protein [Bacteroidetes bacterium endosymbiont of Geopemphigus sp.]
MLKAKSNFSDMAYDSYKKISGEEFRKLRKEGLKNQYLHSRGG